MATFWNSLSVASSILHQSSPVSRGVFHFSTIICRMSSHRCKLFGLGQALSLLLRVWLPLIKLLLMLQYLWVNKTRLCWCQWFFNTADFSWLSDAEKNLGFIENWMVPFWVTSSWAILWKKIVLFVLNKTSPLQSTENILFSNHMVQGFCCCRCCFNSSKIISSQVRINKIGIWSPGHKILRMENDANVCSTLVLLLPFQKRLWCFL